MASVITPQFLAFLEKIKSNRKDFADVKDWARANSRKYFHEVSEKPGFLPIYNSLLSYNNDAKNLPPFATQQEVLTKKPTLTIGEQRVMAVLEAKKSNASIPTNAKAKARTLSNTEIYEESKDSIKHFASLEDWARATSRNYFHQLGGSRKFLDIYKDLLALAEEKDDDSSYTTEEEDDSTYVTESSEESEDESMDDESEEEDDDESYCSEVEVEQSKLVADGLATNAEIAMGRKILNKVLYKEYDSWYSAFAAEEDGENGFIWHCAKILAKKSGVSVEDCALIVEAWLINKKEKVASNDDLEAVEILMSLRKM